MVVASKPGKKQLGQIQTLDRRISDLGYFVTVMPINLAVGVVVMDNLKGRTEKKTQFRLASWVVVMSVIPFLGYSWLLLYAFCAGL